MSSASRLLSGLLLFATGRAMAFPAAPDALSPLQPTVKPQVKTLSNGMVLVADRNTRTDTLAVVMMIRVGAQDELPGEEGCAHLFEHLMFEGSANAPGRTYDEATEGAGISANAWTSSDATAYHAVGITGDLDRLLFLESDRLGWLSPVGETELKNQQDVVLQERNEGYSAPHGRDGDAVQRLLWPDTHPYHRPVIGTVDAIRSFDVQSTASFHGRHYVPENVILVMVGDFEPEVALTRAETWFGAIPAADAPPRQIPPDQPAEPRAARGWIGDPTGDWQRAHLYIGPPRTHPDEAPLRVLARLLDWGAGTRLADRVLEAPAWLDAASADYWTGELGGQLELWAGSSKRRLRAMSRLLDGALWSLHRDPPSETLLQRAKVSLVGELLDSLEDPEQRAFAMAECIARRDPPDCTLQEIDRIRGVGPADIQRVLDTYLGLERRTRLDVLPSGARPPRRVEEVILP